MAEADDPGSLVPVAPSTSDSNALRRRSRGIARVMALVGAVGLAVVAFVAGRVSERHGSVRSAASPAASPAAGGWFMYQPGSEVIYSPSTSGGTSDEADEPGWFETGETPGTLLGQRTVEGVKLTAYLIPFGEGWSAPEMIDLFPDFDPPGWCTTTGLLRISGVADDGDTIGFGGGAWLQAPKDGLNLMPIVVGITEDRPRFGVAAQTDDSITRVAIDASGDRHDEAEPRDGVVMVLVDGAVDDDARVVVTHADGSTTTLQPGHGDVTDRYPAALDPACQPPQPALPAAGAQPADADAARAQVTAAVTAVIMGTDGWHDAVADTAGMERDTEPVTIDSTDDTAWSDSVAADIREIVFTSPTQAWVRFHTFDEGDVFSTIDGFAVVELTEGRWRLTADSACGILSSTDGWCDGDWSTVLPPSAVDDPRYTASDGWYDEDDTTTTVTT